MFSFLIQVNMIQIKQMSELKIMDTLISLSREAKELYLPTEIPRLPTVPSPITFLRNYVTPNLPVVVENSVAHWPALTKWTDEYLKQTLGKKEVTVALTPTGYADAIVGECFVLPDERKMPFDEFLCLMKQKGDKEVMYLQKQNNSFLEEFAELIPDAALDIPWATEAFGKLPDAINFWMGDERSITSMHKDPYENIYAVVRGSKTFILHPPTDLPCIPYELYKVARYKQDRNGGYFINEQRNTDCCDKCVKLKCKFKTASSEAAVVKGKESTPGENACSEQRENAFCKAGDETASKCKKNASTEQRENACSKSEHNPCDENKNRIRESESGINPLNLTGTENICHCHSTTSIPWISINPLSPDLKRFPLYQHSNSLKVTLRPGDVLYLPSLWFHHVQQSEGTIAVNFWYDMEYDIKYNYFKLIENIKNNF
ncbi:bifunctional peptidase and (3S)-lysyl hydroxylase JMJD7-like [Hydractinia symbiolongicarpus]|uniref:bifunctional peptidase and (3S)-lysyl hydroxylase JMJD7-like n=1 Tax=Hydractinia symbiolongicarpus TaxID=13093 RepID=UPI00254C9459|nr:bifunctional peptidase and (3S)-lysyl hydroxylase JMJD7-like [Hydractinia symbiolongicarpus]